MSGVLTEIALHIFLSKTLNRTCLKIALLHLMIIAVTLDSVQWVCPVKNSDPYMMRETAFEYKTSFLFLAGPPLVGPVLDLHLSV